MKTRLTKTSLLTVLLFVFGAAGNAFAKFPEPGVSYRITERNTGKCLDVSGGSLTVAPVGIWDCGEQMSQRWQLHLLEDGSYRITAQHSMMSLDVRGGNPFTNNGVPIQQYFSNNAGAQQWILSEPKDGYYYISSRHSGKFLTIIDGVAIQWDLREGYKQQFKFTPFVGPCSAGS